MSSGDLDYSRQTRSEKKQSAELEGVNGAVGIRNGAQCANFVVDQNTVIFLLNRVPSTSGGSLTPSGPTHFKQVRNGFCDPSLSDAIRRFQQANGLTVDGVVDPHGHTIGRLRSLASGVRPGGGEADRESQLVADVEELITELIIGSQQQAPSVEASQFREIANQLGNLLRQSGHPFIPRVPVGRMGESPAETLDNIAHLAFTLDLSIVTVEADALTHGRQTGISIRILNAILRQAREAQRTVITLDARNRGALAKAVRRMGEIADKIDGPCGSRLRMLASATETFLSVLSLPPAPIATTGGGRRAAQLSRIGEDWVQALSGAIACLGAESGNPLLRAIHEPIEGGLTLFAILRRFLNVRNLPGAPVGS